MKYILIMIIVILFFIGCDNSGSSSDRVLEEIENESSDIVVDEPIDEPIDEQLIQETETQVLEIFKEVFATTEEGLVELNGGGIITFEEGIPFPGYYLTFTLILSGTPPGGSQNTTRSITLEIIDGEVITVSETYTLEYGEERSIAFIIPEEAFLINFSGGPNVEWEIKNVELKQEI